MSGRKKNHNPRDTKNGSTNREAKAAGLAELAAAKATAIAKADEILAGLHTPVNKLKRVTAADMNSFAREYWSQPEAHIAYAWIASEELRQQEKSAQVKPASAAKLKQGINTLDLVRSEAVKLQNKSAGKQFSRQYFAQTIAGKIPLSEAHTLKLLRKLQIPK